MQHDKSLKTNSNQWLSVEARCGEGRLAYLGLLIKNFQVGQFNRIIEVVVDQIDHYARCFLFFELIVQTCWTIALLR